MEVNVKTILINSEKYGIHELLVSDEDYDICVRIKWILKPDNNRFYAHGVVNGKLTTIHRMLLSNQLTNELVVDHIDGNGLNNTRENIRVVTRAENARNRKTPTNSSSGITGVTLDRKGDTVFWKAKIEYNGKVSSKRFSINYYGFEKAKELAILQRKKWESELGYISR